jgi:hypothetical protein
LRTRVWVADVNGDGKLDLIVGDSVTLIAPAKGVSVEEFKKKFAAWRKAVESATKELSSRRPIRKNGTRPARSSTILTTNAPSS